jgi:hypothetical protein
MECQLLAGQFLPPAPYTLDGYFDRITDGQFVQVRLARILAYHIQLEGVLTQLASKPAVERAALLGVLATRLEAYGTARGLTEPPSRSQDPATTLTEFLIKDIFGLSSDSVEEKSVGKLKSLLFEFIKDGLTRTGKHGLEFLAWVWRLINASSSELSREFLTLAPPALAEAFQAVTGRRVLGFAMKRAGFSSAVRRRVLRIVALRLAFLEPLAARAAKFSGVVFALDLLLTPEMIVSDTEEERLAHLENIARVFTDFRLISSSIIERCEIGGPKYRFDPVTHLAQTIRAAR